MILITVLNISRENQSDTNFKPEEFWECNSYEDTTAIFDPKG